jgi:prevent-host-death family protein
MEIGIKQAKTDLSKLVRAALRGEKVVIANRGKPLVELVPITRPAKPDRGYGSMRKALCKLPKGWDSFESEEAFARQFELVNWRPGK